jgi:hypothetical protein
MAILMPGRFRHFPQLSEGGDIWMHKETGPQSMGITEKSPDSAVATDPIFDRHSTPLDALTALLAANPPNFGPDIMDSIVDHVEALRRGLKSYKKRLDQSSSDKFDV